MKNNVYVKFLFFILCVLTAHVQTKDKIKGLAAFLFPIPIALYNAGFDAASTSEYVQIHKSYVFDQTKISFKDVAGLDGAKEDLQDIVDFLNKPEKFKQMGAKIPKGILMQGDSGCGKTLLARALAGEVGCAFIHVNGSDFNSSYMGQNSQKVQELFISARKKAPCVIFIDEIDSLAGIRMTAQGFGSIENNNNTLNTLLTEMDGFEQYQNPVVVIAATNRRRDLDPAILRPGRFDRIIDIGKPLIKDRIELLQIACRKVPLADDVKIDRIARATIGFTGAQLVNLINEAAILAVKDNVTQVSMAHIQAAHDNITLGREIKGMKLSQNDFWQTAIHEAGHVIGYIFQDTTVVVHKVSIVPRTHTLGVAHMLPLKESYSMTKNDMENRIVSLLAGRFAEEAFGICLSSGASNDLEKAKQIAHDMVIIYGMSDGFRDISYYQSEDTLSNDVAAKIDNEINFIIKKCRIIAKDLIVRHKNDIKKIAELLIQKGTVQGHEIYSLLNIPEPVGVGF